jgi:hypothetical protein
MVKKRQCKFVSLFLLLIFLIPFVPVLPVSADPLPVQVPDFPHNQDDYYNVNNGGFALWQVHGSNHVSYVQTFSPGVIGKPDPVVIFNKTIFYDNYTYYLDVNYITDTWDIYGNHIPGWPGSNTNNIRVPRPLNNPEIPDSDVYATLVYCTDDVRWRNGSDTGIYMFMNYLVPGYADPTPTPIPKPEIKGWYDYPELPSNFSADTLCILRAHNVGVNEGALIGIAFSPSGSVFNYPIFYKDRSNWNYRSQALFDNGITINTWSNSWNFSVFTVNYDDANDTYSVGNSLKNTWGSPGDSWYLSSNLDWRGETLTCWSLFPDNPLIVTGEQAGEYSTGSWFEILFTNHNKTPGTSSNPNVSPTPTATPIPTAIPQPTQNPDPTSTPEPDVKVVTPSDHWWDGLIKPIQYIFVPSQDKMVKLYNTAANKFGIQKPTEFKLDLKAIFRPDDVVLHFHPVSLNGEAAETVDVTLIDFKMVDDWLDSAPGKVSIRIIRAIFSLTMFAYMIYIYRKHIATINYTDADTLMDDKYWK